MDGPRGNHAKQNQSFRGKISDISLTGRILKDKTNKKHRTERHLDTENKLVAREEGSVGIRGTNFQFIKLVNPKNVT